MGEQKKGNGLVGLIVSLLLSAVYSFAVVHFIEVKQLGMDIGLKGEIVAIILGIVGAFITLLIVNAIMKRFTVFTRNPIKFYVGMYVFWPCIGVVLGQFAMFLLLAKIFAK